MRLACFTLICLLTVGCRNLDLPDDLSTQNPGPTLSFLSPLPLPDGGSPEVGLQGFVLVQAEDADGVASVDLACESPDGGANLAHMSQAPYQTSVDFGPCRPVGSSASALFSLTLRAIGTDQLGNTSAESRTVEVQVNAATASLTLDLPDRVPPGKTFNLTVHSDLPLQGPPTVDVEGIGSAQYLSTTSTGGVSNYLYRTAPAPLLGADGYSGSPPIPLAVLEEAERPLAVHVEGRATSGNQSTLTAQVILSRVLWDTPLPSAAFGGAQDSYVIPTIAPGGLQVPLSSTGTWVPAYFDADTGQPSVFPPNTFTTLFPRAFDPFGRTVLAPTVVFAPPISSRVIDALTGVVRRDASPAILQTTNRPLFPVASYVCEENVTVAAPTCPSSAARPIRCLSATGELTINTPSTPPYDAASPPWGVSSGNILLLGGLNGPCSSPLTSPAGVRLFDVTGTSPSVGYPLAAHPTYDYTNLSRVLPVGDGTFIGASQITNLIVGQISITGTQPNFVNIPTLNGSFINSGELLLARPDTSVIGFRADPPYTFFFSFKVGDAAITSTVRVDSAFDLSLAPVPHIPTNAYLDSQGRLFALVRRKGFSASSERVVVLSLDATLKPRWIYHYTRPDSANVYDLHLAMDEAKDRVYLIDGNNGHVVALSR